jgi:hypothetical protein
MLTKVVKHSILFNKSKKSDPKKFIHPLGFEPELQAPQAKGLPHS